MSSTTIADPNTTADGPTESAIGPTMMIGRKLAMLTSMLSTPKTRPRMFSGSSSCSCV